MTARAQAPGPRRLGDHTSDELAARPTLLVVPIGSCEQHGPHLPLDTDTRIAIALSDALVAALPDALVTPAVAISASGEHAGFPGTLSIGVEVTTAVLVELVRSADWAGGVVFVNGHGGNVEAVRRAVERSRADGRRVVSWWPRAAGADAHAGHTETSLMLAIDPAVVRTDRAVRGRTEPVGELIGELRRGGVRAVSPNGVLGDPTSATAEHGRALFDALVRDLVASVTTEVTAWRPATADAPSGRPHPEDP